MSYLILSNINLDIVNKQTSILINYLDKLKKKKIYYLNIFDTNIEKKFTNKHIVNVNISKWIKNYTLDINIVKLYDKFIKYKYSVLINNSLDNPKILLSIFLDEYYKKNIKTYLELVYKIVLELKVEQVFCFDLILIESMYNLFNLLEPSSLQNIIKLQKKINLFVLDEVSYFDNMFYLDNLINFKSKYKNYYISILTNNKYILESYNNLNNLKYENINYLDSNNSLIDKYYYTDIVDNNIIDKLKNIKKVLLQEKNSYIVFSHFNNNRICLTIHINYLYNIKNELLWFLIQNECRNKDYDNYLETELNDIISNSMIYINMVQKIIELIFMKLVNFFNENKIINKDLKLEFKFIGRCFFNLEDLNNKNFEYNYNIDNIKNIKNKISYGFDRINKNFIDSYLINLDTLKLNLGLYIKVENILLYSNMFFNNYTDNLINKYPNYKSLMNPDLVIKFYNEDNVLEQCDNIQVNF